MGQQICRVGDVGVGVCFGHDSPTPFVTVFMTGDGVVEVEGRGMVRVGDIGLCSCGHVSIAAAGAAVSQGSNGAAPHRIGDPGVSSGPGTYVATSGSAIADSE